MQKFSICAQSAQLSPVVFALSELQKARRAKSINPNPNASGADWLADVPIDLEPLILLNFTNEDELCVMNVTFDELQQLAFAAGFLAMRPRLLWWLKQDCDSIKELETIDLFIFIELVKGTFAVAVNEIGGANE
tara:strand:+ start:9039 stop:9440 length:402 start_codon:yes stop_codon:yes gene_type:complete